MKTQARIVVATSRRHVWLLALLVSACGGAATTAPPMSDATLSTTTPPVTLSERIATLERSGALPTLDRSPNVPGPDRDGDGVRDDIRAWINSLQMSPTQQKGSLQLARSLQGTLVVNLQDERSLQTAGELTADAINCLHDTFDPDYKSASALVRKLEAITFNTLERTKRYIQYNGALSGTVTRMLSSDTCDK